MAPGPRGRAQLMGTLDVDVAVVGAGVVGCAVAARLSLDRLSVAVLERRHDVADETSKSNTGVTDSGWECQPGTLEAKLVSESSLLWEEVADRFDVPFKRCGGLCIARSDDEVPGLREVHETATRNGVRTRLLSRDDTLTLAPYVAPTVCGAVEVPNEGIVDSIRLTLGYAEAGGQKRRALLL